MKSLFLSHSHADKKFARKLAKDLRDHDVYIWIDEAEIKIGDSLLQKIGEGIDRVDYVGAILSSTSVKSKWVQREIDIAMNQEIEGRRVKVLPILIEDCDLPSFLLGKLYADFRSSYSQGLKALLATLEAREFIGPHQPIIRSHEISVSARSMDQIPQVVRKGNYLFIQWVEHREDIDVVYIYVLDTIRFQFLDYFFYTIPSEIHRHWLVTGAFAPVSFVHLLDERELWCTDLSHPSKLSPVKIAWSPRFVESIIPTAKSFLISSSSKHKVELVEVSPDGLIKRRKSKRLSHWPSNTSLTRVSDGIGVFLNTLRGIEFSLVNKAFSFPSPKIIVPSKQHNTIPANLDVRFYDNCTYAGDGDAFLLYHYDSEDGEEINVCNISPNGRAIKSATVVSNSDREVHVFKPSFGVGHKSILVLWNVKQRRSQRDYKIHEKTLLCCMLFDKETFKPLLPYDRTLTTGSNYSSGVPVAVNKDTYYIVYQEDTLEQFKIKVSEISLDELPR